MYLGDGLERSCEMQRCPECYSYDEDASRVLRPPARSAEDGQGNGGEKNAGEIEEPVMRGQVAGGQVEDVDERVEDIESGRGEHHAAMAAGAGSGEAESESESEKGSAYVAHEVDVERAGIGDAGREAVIPRARREEHPQTVRGVK